MKSECSGCGGDPNRKESTDRGWWAETRCRFCGRGLVYVAIPFISQSGGKNAEREADDVDGR